MSLSMKMMVNTSRGAVVLLLDAWWKVQPEWKLTSPASHYQFKSMRADADIRTTQTQTKLGCRNRMCCMIRRAKSWHSGVLRQSIQSCWRCTAQPRITPRDSCMTTLFQLQQPTSCAPASMCYVQVSSEVYVHLILAAGTAYNDPIWQHVVVT